MLIKVFVSATNCYVSDFEEGEKTLLLYEEEGKLSKVQSRLIYRFSKGSSVHRAGLHSGAEADRSNTVTLRGPWSWELWGPWSFRGCRL